MTTPSKVLDLIERFDADKKVYLSTAYKETEVREDFINPFFEALGWDVDNKSHAHYADRQVIKEYTLRPAEAMREEEEAQELAGKAVAIATKSDRRPDYAFRIGGALKFFVEAKKPSGNIESDRIYAYQVRSYGWNAGLPISALTDFEELAIYDCAAQPFLADPTASNRPLYLKYEEYADNWSKIEELLSYEAVRDGALDKFAAGRGTRKGTTTVDAAFLREISEWRKLLAEQIALSNPALTQRDLNYAVQMIIDRIIFLRIAEDQGSEPYRSLQGAITGFGAVYPQLCNLFRTADERYNSGLFHFKREKGRDDPDGFTLTLAIPDEPLRHIVNRLYYPESPYKFSVMPIEVLGQVYEQFLGKVIRVESDRHVEVEDKPEVRKAGGVYYTPTYIVDYIVEHTVGKLLHAKTTKEAASLRILDPACGSGSFLIGAYSYLLNWHLERYLEEGASKHKRELVEIRPGEHRLSLDERKRILRDNIYGVDIDTQAVEVTKLSLLLKVLEDEAVRPAQARFGQERILPDLDDNIKCGNSLIGPDFYNRQASFVDSEEMYRINAFDWDSAFPAIMKAGGFDAVIGNPPYVRQEILSKLKGYFQQHFRTYHGVADLYVYFIERGAFLLKPGGILGYIVASKWLRTSYGETLRRWMKEQRIVEITDFGALPVFKSATTYTCILQLSKDTPSEQFRVTQVRTLAFLNLSEYVLDNSYPVKQSDLPSKGWSLSDDRQQRLQDKLHARGIPLDTYVQGSVYYGVKTGLNEAFVINAETKEALIAEDASSAELIKPFLVGRDIKRYQPTVTDHYVLFTRRGVDIGKYPAVEQYLRAFKDRLIPKPKDWEGELWTGRKPGPYQWYEIQDTVEYYKEFEKPKILWPGISAEVTAFAFDEQGNYGNDNTQLIVTGDLYLLGVINSQLMRFLLTSICDKVQGGFYRLKMVYIQQLPIRTINFNDPKEKAQHDQMVSLVERMLALHKQLATARTPYDRENIKRQIEATDRQIDRLVYTLYDLTEEEIGIVEGRGAPGVVPGG